MALDTLTVTLAVPKDIYLELAPKYDAEGNIVEEEDFPWSPEDDVLARMQDIIVDTGERLGLTIIPLFRFAGECKNDTDFIIRTSNLTVSYRPDSDQVPILCDSTFENLNHAIVLAHPEHEHPYISTRSRKLIEALNIPFQRLFLQEISENLLNREDVSETLKRAMEFAADPPFKFD